jgi:hypothetical protein
MGEKYVHYPETGEYIKIIGGPFTNFWGVMEEVDPANDRYRIAVKIFGRSTPVEVSLKQLDYDTSKKPFRFDPGPCPGIPEREYRMVTARNMAFWIKIRDENGRPRSGAEMRHEANELEYEKRTGKVSPDRERDRRRKEAGLPTVWL